MTRDRAQTEQRLIDAVHELITDVGFNRVGINRIAQHARVNKILIYRYFGGLDGLIKAYYEKYQPVASAPLIDSERLKGVPLEEFFKACCDFIIAEFRLLRANPQAQEVLRNDLLGSRPGTPNPIAFQKEEQIRIMVEKLSNLIQSQYGRSFAAVIISGMTMLTFMAQDKRTVMGIEMGTDEAWEEIEQTIQRVFHGVHLAAKERIGDMVPLELPLTDRQEPV